MADPIGVFHPVGPGALAPLVFGLGSSSIQGTIVSSADVRDYVTFTVPVGLELSGLVLEDYFDVASGGTIPPDIGFHAIYSGATSFVPGPGTAESFLGGDHLTVDQIGFDQLPVLATAPLAGTGFGMPLGPGTYSYLVQ